MEARFAKKDHVYADLIKKNAMESVLMKMPAAQMINARQGKNASLIPVFLTAATLRVQTEEPAVKPGNTVSVLAIINGVSAKTSVFQLIIAALDLTAEAIRR